MSIQVSRAHALMSEALDYRAARQDMISSNIANADTPNYRSRDIHFESMLAQKKAEIFGNGSNQLKMATTDDRHLEPEQVSSVKSAVTYFRDGHGMRNDGNTVDLDVETTEMSKNAIMYNALLAAKKKGGAIYRSVIDASSKTA